MIFSANKRTVISTRGLILFLTFTFSGMAHSHDAASGDEDRELAQLMMMLEQETELATQNKMNVDYVPGMMTLLQGKEMQARGFETVAEALNSVSGFYTAKQNDGSPVATVRGVGASLVGNNLKLMINSLPVNRPTDSKADWVMRMPLHHIERIEVIRGPGAALYGEYAFSGVVNIVTRRGNDVSISLGSDNLKQTDWIYEKEDEHGFITHLNASIRQRDDSGRQTNPDNFANNGHGYSKGDIDDNEQYGLVIAGIEYQDVAVDINYAREIRGGWHGKNGVSPREVEPYIETIFSAQAQKQWQLSEALEMNVRLGYLKTDIEEAEYLPIPKGVNPPGPSELVEEDRFRQDKNSDSTRRFAWALHWQGWQHHKLFAELAYVQSNVTDSSVWSAIDEGPQTQESPDRSIVLEDAEQSLRSATLQDQWQVNEKLEITTGARFDDYDEWGSAISPRFAAVWRKNDRHLFKFQYAQAFRPPSLANQFPGPESFPNTVFEALSDESINTTELAYIYRNSSNQLRSTLYYSEVKDLIEFFIQPGQPPVWHNRGDIRAYGLELEFQQKLNRHWQWDANLAYSDTKDKFDQDDALFGSVKWLANLSVTWNPTPSQRHTLSAHYTGEQEGSDRLTFVPNQHFDAYSTLNYSATFERLAQVDNLSATIAVQNLGNTQYNTVANPTQYPLGLTGEKRRFWLSLRYEY